jgi:hypothetical protein
MTAAISCPEILRASKLGTAKGPVPISISRKDNLSIGVSTKMGKQKCLPKIVS